MKWHEIEFNLQMVVVNVKVILVYFIQKRISTFPKFPKSSEYSGSFNLHVLIADVKTF